LLFAIIQDTPSRCLGAACYRFTRHPPSIRSGLALAFALPSPLHAKLFSAVACAASPSGLAFFLPPSLQAACMLIMLALPVRLVLQTAPAESIVPFPTIFNELRAAVWK
jgi:hypothetical protein